MRPGNEVIDGSVPLPTHRERRGALLVHECPRVGFPLRSESMLSAFLRLTRSESVRPESASLVLVRPAGSASSDDQASARGIGSARSVCANAAASLSVQGSWQVGEAVWAAAERGVESVPAMKRIKPLKHAW